MELPKPKRSGYVEARGVASVYASARRLIVRCRLFSRMSQGTFLASSGGDCTVKIWDFAKQACVATYTDHNQAVWSVAFHNSGNFVASCSLDHAIRLWDVTVGKCQKSLRGHVDSVNEVLRLSAPRMLVPLLLCSAFHSSRRFVSHGDGVVNDAGMLAAVQQRPLHGLLR